MPQCCKRSARLWNRLLEQPLGTLARRALEASLALARDEPAGMQRWRRSWVGKLAQSAGGSGIAA